MQSSSPRPLWATLMHEQPDAFEPAGAPFNTDTKVGIAVRRDNAVLKAALGSALQALVKDGSYDPLIKKWGMPASSSVF